jgi:hypothetical protein
MAYTQKDFRSPGLFLPQKTFGMEKRTQCHKMVMNVAVEMANTIYERCAGLSNAFRKQHPSQRAYVRKALPYLIPQARATLTDLLVQTRDPVLKDEIYEALCLDNQFVSRVV